MLDLFESAPFGVTTLIVAALCLLAVAALARFVPLKWMWLVSIVTPLFIAWLVYWMPFWIRPHTYSSEYSAWELLFIVAWGGAGIIVSLIFVGLLVRYRRRKVSHV